MTSDGISSLEEFPESLVIIGAGVIGCEFATIFSNFRKTKVHLISKDDRILPFEDEEPSGIFNAFTLYTKPSVEKNNTDVCVLTDKVCITES